MLSNKHLIIFGLLMLVSLLGAFSVSDNYYGHPPYGQASLGQRYGVLDARGMAMGGTGVFNDMRPGSIAINPANITVQNRYAGLSLNTIINRAEDTRMLPLYNSFDAYIDDSVYASNINAFTDFAGAGFAAMTFGKLHLGLGAYHAPYISFSGKYSEEIRNNRNTDSDGYPEKIAQNEIDNVGTLMKTAMAASIGFDLADYWNVNLGMDFALMSADVEQETTIRWSDWSVQQVGEDILPEYTRTRDWELEGEQLKLGAAFRMGPRWGLGLTMTPKTSLDLSGTDYTLRDAYRNVAQDSTVVVMDGDYDLPAEFKAGISYYPRNVMRTVFNAELEMVQYSDVDDLYDDVFNFYAGVEHHVVNRVPLRLGFQAVSSYFQTMEEDVNSDGDPYTYRAVKKVISPMITGGSSVQLYKNWVLDLGFGFGWREYQALDLFGDKYYDDRVYTGGAYALWPNTYIDLQNRGWENPDKVKENIVSFNAGISFSW
ncbi:MAG: hypothetical protein WC190_02985 [Candidatus Cloacimonadaceae bacterium]|jgi:hypothetical protein|nr:hypothetical protein [Candidatus Cloacimonadota bacterium]MDD2616818.1 hypothetical protein [Candidatus Cloacimonadota bacterium]MDD2718682.1 hypothetical protein [Candidatus Cloacimonadota bacterium]MDD4233750.1 hypothetical protein [Candidatus Cloacimonadota bacterium]MDD4790253.1 hypothetical protein [Candidatus Cloacimonadota bacterium]